MRRLAILTVIAVIAGGLGGWAVWEINQLAQTFMGMPDAEYIQRQLEFQKSMTPTGDIPW